MTRLVFLLLSAAIALVGLFAAAASHDYLQLFGTGLMLFGVVFGFGVIKRHYDEAEGAAQRPPATSSVTPVM